jgi:hypothetical protein
LPKVPSRTSSSAYARRTSIPTARTTATFTSAGGGDGDGSALARNDTVLSAGAADRATGRLFLPKEAGGCGRGCRWRSDGDVGAVKRGDCLQIAVDVGCRVNHPRWLHRGGGGGGRWGGSVAAYCSVAGVYVADLIGAAAQLAIEATRFSASGIHAATRSGLGWKGRTVREAARAVGGTAAATGTGFVSCGTGSEGWSDSGGICINWRYEG